LLQSAVDIYKRDANVRIIPSRPFRYFTGFLDAETVTGDWVQIDGAPSDTDVLDPSCNAGGALAEWWLGGSKIQVKVSTLCFFGAGRRWSGYGAPVACFIVRSVQDRGGCALWITDFATVVSGVVPPGNPALVAHELGHACN